MPSLRKPLTLKQRLVAVCSDPATYLFADLVARGMSKSGNLADYRRNVTCYLLDMESRIHRDSTACTGTFGSRVDSPST